jgi:GTPase involved in cell partitioning and DNA repair
LSLTGIINRSAWPTCRDIIEGAAEGKGLGHRFLRHIERNSVLLFVIPADCNDHAKEFDILLNELEQYNPKNCSIRTSSLP